MKLGVGSIEAISRGLNWLSFILAGLLLSSQQLGLYSALVAICLIFSSIACSGQERTLLRYFAASTNIRLPATLISLIGGGLTVAVLYIFTETELIELPSSFALISIWLFFTSQLTLHINHSRAANDLVGFTIFRLIYTLIKFLGTLAICWNYKSAVSLVFFEVILVVLVSSYGFFRYLSSMQTKLSNRQMKRSIHFGLPFIIHVAAGSCMGHIDKLMLIRSVDVSLVGKYAFLNSIASGVFFLFAVLNMKWETAIYQEKKQAIAEQKLANLLKFSLIAGICILVFVNLFAKSVLTAIGKTELYDLATLSILSLAYGVYPFYLQANIRFAWQEKTKYIPMLTILASVVNIGANIVLIPSLGIVGAAIATLMSYVTLSALTQYFSLKLIEK